jgi:hypothetical protein
MSEHLPPSMDTLCKVYVKIRTAKQEKTKEYEEVIAGLDAKLEELESVMKDMLVAAGAKSIKTEHGTVYAQTKTRYYPMDWHAFGNWVIQNNAIDLLEKRVAQGNMTKWLESDPNNPPPGIQADTQLTVTVRKA